MIQRTLCTVYTVHCVQCTMHIIHYTVYCTVCNVFSAECTLHIIQCTVQCTLYNAQWTLCSVYNAHYTVYNLHYSMSALQEFNLLKMLLKKKHEIVNGLLSHFKSEEELMRRVSDLLQEQENLLNSPLIIPCNVNGLNQLHQVKTTANASIKGVFACGFFVTLRVVNFYRTLTTSKIS